MCFLPLNAVDAHNHEERAYERKKCIQLNKRSGGYGFTGILRTLGDELYTCESYSSLKKGRSQSAESHRETSDQEEAANMSDRIGIMDHGQIVQLGRPNEVDLDIPVPSEDSHA